jgi:hypothetical protein
MTRPLCFVSASIFAAAWANSLVNGSTGIAAKTVSRYPRRFCASSAVLVSAMEAVLQFDHGNGREHDLGFAVHLFKAGEQAADPGLRVTLCIPSNASPQMLPRGQVSRILKAMNVHLTPDQKAFARRAIESGRLHSEEDAVQEALAHVVKEFMRHRSSI